MQIEEYLSRTGMTQREFSKLNGISPNATNNYVRGIRAPTLEIADRIITNTRGMVTLKDLLKKKKDG